MTLAKEIEDLKSEVVAVRMTPSIKRKIAAIAKSRYRSQSPIVTVAI